MNRRHFIRQVSAMGTFLVGANAPLQAIQRHRKLGLSIASYRRSDRFYSDQFPAWKNALDVLDHCQSLGAGCLQIGVRGWTRDFAGKVREKRESLGIALEGQIGLPRSEDQLAAFEASVQRAKEAGASVLRAVCLGGRRYETFKSIASWQAFQKDSLAALERAEPVMRRHRVRLAVENHKDWRTAEQLNWLEHLSSEYVGVCFDFGNNLSLLEDPHQQLESLAPYVMTTHLKDMGLAPYESGFLLSEVPLGQGILNLNALCDRCLQSSPHIQFNLEMITRDPLKVPVLESDFWITMEELPARDLAWVWKQVQQKGQDAAAALPSVSQKTDPERLAYEEANVRACFQYARQSMGFDEAG